ACGGDRREHQQWPPLQYQRGGGGHRHQRGHRRGGRVRIQPRHPDRDERGEHGERSPPRPAREQLPGLRRASRFTHVSDATTAASPSAGPRDHRRGGHKAVRRTARAVAATASTATAASDPVAEPRPSHGTRTALVSMVSGSGPATARTAEPITCGGGPPAPSRNDGKNSSRPMAWADRADGSSEPSSTPRLTNATAPSGSATATRHQSCMAGMPYTGAATASSRPHATAVVTSPTMSCAAANDHRGNPAAAKRRSTPRSR